MKPVAADFGEDNCGLAFLLETVCEPAFDTLERRADCFAMILIAIAVELRKTCALFIDECLVSPFIVRVHGHVEVERKYRFCGCVILDLCEDLVRHLYPSAGGSTLWGKVGKTRTSV